MAQDSYSSNLGFLSCRDQPAPVCHPNDVICGAGGRHSKCSVDGRQPPRLCLLTQLRRQQAGGMHGGMHGGMLLFPLCIPKIHVNSSIPPHVILLLTTFAMSPHYRVGGALCGDYVCGVAIVSTACSVHGLSGGLLQEPVLPVPWRNASFHVNLCIPPHEMMHSPLHSLNVRSFDPIAGVSHCWRRLLVKHRRGG